MASNLEKFKWLDLSLGIREGREYLRPLESMRGLAVRLVYFFHLHGIYFGPAGRDRSILMSYQTEGHTGVTLFFVLSGFLLSSPYLTSAFSGTAMPSIRNFYTARAIRILPLYYIVVLVAMVMTDQLWPGIKALIFLPVGDALFPFSTVWWTLSIEVQFYFLLPLFFLLLQTGRWGQMLLGLAAIAWISAYLYLCIFNQLPSHGYGLLVTQSIFTRVPAFGVGVLAAGIFIWLKQRDDAFRNSRTARWMGSLFVISLLLGLGLVLQESGRMGRWQAEFAWQVKNSYQAMFWGGIVLCLILLKPYGAQLIDNPFLTFMGKISYSFYLLHLPILFYFLPIPVDEIGKMESLSFLSFYSIAILYLLLCIAVSCLSFQFIERPILRIKSRIRD